MNRLPITLDEMSAAIAELHATLPKFGLTTENAPVVARAYREALMPLDREAVAGGAKLGLRLWDKFPPPKAWREAIREWVKHNRIPPKESDDIVRDGEGRAIICLTCRSVAKSAWLRRTDGTEYSRLIAPCNLERHAPGDHIVAMPDNFLAWDDRTAEQHMADNERATKAKR